MDSNTGKCHQLYLFLKNSTAEKFYAPDFKKFFYNYKNNIIVQNIFSTIYATTVTNFHGCSWKRGDHMVQYVTYNDMKLRMTAKKNHVHTPTDRQTDRHVHMHVVLMSSMVYWIWHPKIICSPKHGLICKCEFKFACTDK